MILINFNWYELVLAVMSLAVHDGQVVKNPSLLGFITPPENPDFEWGLMDFWTFEALPVPKIISWKFSSFRKRTWVNCTSAGQAMTLQRG